jgi:VIT1/CCC1 family predicted Fe2+/Mn2+ transporter
MEKDALAAHARDELGMSEVSKPHPVQAAIASAAAFSAGAAAPLIFVLAAPSGRIIPVVAVGSLLCLAVLGYLGARTGGAKVLHPVLRVTFWGTIAMALTALIGHLFGTVV